MDGLNNFLDKYGQIIVWVPTIIFLVIVLINILKGLRRGFRKNLILMIISISSLVVAYLIFLLILKKPFFEKGVLDIIKSTSGRSLNKMLGVSEEYTRFKTIISAKLASTMSESNQQTYGYFSPYVEAMAESILGVIYLIVTLILWRIIYFFIGYLIIYNIFLSERKYKRNKQKAIENYKVKQEQENNNQMLGEIEKAIEAENNREVSQINVDEEESSVATETPHINPEAATSSTTTKDIPKPYKRRRMLGGLVGVVRGILLSMIFLSVLGTIFYIVTGNKTDVAKSDDYITVEVGDNVYDLTDVYNFIYDYDHTGVNLPLNHARISGTPIYVAASNLFCNGKIVVREDNISTKIYPIEELANVMNIMHTGVEIVNKYDINLSKDNLINKLIELIDENEEFVDDMYDFINSFGSGGLYKALSKTITAHFADIVTSSGVKNEYFNIVFKGEHAITITDILSKEDIRQFIVIASKALAVYQDYDDTKDIKNVIVTACNDVSKFLDEFIKLSIFSSENKQNLNGCISDLFELALSKNDTLKDVSLSGIVWFGDSGNGLVARFIKSVSRFLNSESLLYEEGKIKFNYQKINFLFDKIDGSSIMDDIKLNDAIRRIATVILEKAVVDGNKLYIPKDCLDSDGYISSDEFIKFFDSLEKILNAMDFSSLASSELSDIVKVLVPELIDSIQKNGDLPEYVVSSNVLTAVASKYLYETIKDNYSVPSSLILDDDSIETNIENWLHTNGELYYLLKAICAVGTIDDVSINTVFKLDDDDIEAFGGSQIISSIVTSMIKTYSIEEIDLILPDEALNENGFVTSQELKGIIHTIKALVNYDSLSDEEKEDISFDDIEADVSTIVENTNVFDSIFESLIIEATISYKIATADVGTLTIPEHLVLESTESSNFANWLYASGELYKFLLGIKDLGIASSISGDSSEIDINTILESNKISEALNSDIIWYTVSTNIKNVEEENENFAIPSSVCDSNNNIVKEEIVAVIEAVKELEKFEISKDISSFDQNKILTNDYDISKILASVIAWYSISKSFINTTGVTIPNASYVDVTQTEKYITKDEIINTISALKIFEMTNLDSITLDSTLFISLAGDKAKLDAVLASYISYHEISRAFSDKITSMPNNVKLQIEGDNYIDKDELESIVDVFEILDITSLTEYEVSSSTVINLNDEEYDTVLSSYIIWYEISSQFKSSDTFTLVKNAMDYTVDDESIYLKKSEIKNILTILKGLNISDFNTTETNPIAISDAGLIDNFKNSYVMRATLSKKVFYDTVNGHAGKLINTSDAYTLETKYEDNEEMVVYTEAETENIIEGLVILNITDADSGISFDYYTFASESASDREKVLDSYTLWVYASDLLRDNLSIPDEYLETKQIIYYEDGIFTDNNYKVVTKERLTF